MPYDNYCYCYIINPPGFQGHYQFTWRILPLSQAIELMLESHHRDSRDPFDFKKKTNEELTDWHKLVQVGCHFDRNITSFMTHAQHLGGKLSTK